MNATATTTTHASDCSAVSPCSICSDMLSNAREARHAYDSALAILDDLSASVLVTQGDVRAFNRAYSALLDARDDFDRIISAVQY